MPEASIPPGPRRFYVAEYAGGSRRVVVELRPATRRGSVTRVRYPWYIERRTGDSWGRVRPSVRERPPRAVVKAAIRPAMRDAALLGLEAGEAEWMSFRWPLVWRGGDAGR